MVDSITVVVYFFIHPMDHVNFSNNNLQVLGHGKNGAMV